MENYIKELKTNGYTIIPNILTENEIETAKQLFKDWKKTVPNHDKLHDVCDPHGIYKHHEIGHQQHAWFIRTRPKVKSAFATLWETDDLVVSFDGTCWIPKNCSKRDNFWCHSDQSPLIDKFVCAQGFVSLTDNKERTLIIWKNTHKIHSKYLQLENKKNLKSNWQKIPPEHEKLLLPLKTKLNVPAGSLVLWDSRIFHQNQYGKPNSEERIVQYVCMLPKNSEKNTAMMKKKRRDYFKNRRTTSHWPYPIKVNGLQPRNYGNKELIIDYNSLRSPDLSNYTSEIENLI